MSFVNSIATTKGGTHVNYIVDQIVGKVLSAVEKKNKAVPIKAPQVKNYMSVFVNCLIENPTFDSQTKENMTLKTKDFGSECVLSEKFMKDVLKTDLVENILNWAKFKSQEKLSKVLGAGKRARISGIPKLDDANEAGGKNSERCTLILTEGDSAKTLAISGLSIVGRDYYGVFPLRGKLLNVRDASHAQIEGNAELTNIVKIMGLQYGREYTNLKSLRYGKLMIMADQDHDGSHIKGLIINFIHNFWPSLIKVPGFLVEFITPIVKCTRRGGELSFFTIPQYEAWAHENNGGKGWKIKYYKGLGTSTPEEARQYFAAMDEHHVSFMYTSNNDDASIDLAFNKKKADDRKEWLRTYEPGTFIDHSSGPITYNDFVHKELILFSRADNERSIPCIVDGLKPGQRKVLFACFKRNLSPSDEIKVAQLIGNIAETTLYHHGEMSLASTIIIMAQTFVGANNITLLRNIGQFGTRIMGGKDAASPRYIHTTLSSIARLIYHPDDDPLLEYLNEEGCSIEPTFYVPVIPMALVNGAEGIGTGWSTSIPCYNPTEIIENLKSMIDGGEAQEMAPWYKGFNGEIQAKGAGKFLVKGMIEKSSPTTLEITELPIQTWTQSYKEFLETLVDEDKIKDYKEHHADVSIHFIIQMTEEQMTAAETIGLYKMFKLESSIATSNMVLFDERGRIQKYPSTKSIMNEFFALRLDYYIKRKAYLTEKLTDEWTKLENKVRFILEMIRGTLVVSNKPKKVLMAELKAKGYKPFPSKASGSSSVEEQEEVDDDVDGESATPSGGYTYLLSMALWNLTQERVKKLQDEAHTKETELNALLEKSPQTLWKNDLDAILAEMDAIEIAAEEERNATIKIAQKSRKKASKTKKDDDFDDSGDEWKPSKPKAVKKATVPALLSNTSSSKPITSYFPPPSTSSSSASITVPASSLNGLKEKTMTKAPAMTKPIEKEIAPMNDDIFFGEHEDDFPPKKAAPKRKKATKDDSEDEFMTASSKTSSTKPKVSMDALIDSDSDDDYFASSSKKKSEPSKKPSSVSASAGNTENKPKRTVKAAKITYAESDEDEDEDFSFLSASSHLKDKAEEYSFSPETKKKPAAPKTTTSKPTVPKMTAPKKIIQDDSDEEEVSKKATASKKETATKAPAKKAAPKKKAEDKENSVSVKKTSAPKKKQISLSDEDEEGDEAKPALKVSPVASRPSRNARAASKNIKYSFSDEEDGDEDFIKVDESDFELDSD